jgi:hypothetical protein
MSEDVPAPFPGDTEYVAPPPESTQIMTLEELITSQEALTSKESYDRIAMTQFANPDPTAVRTRLLQWAGLGFPNIFVLLSLELVPPTVCIDGVSRSPFQYVEYLTGTSLSDHVLVLQQKLPGMALSYSTPGNNIRIHVSKG